MQRTKKLVANTVMLYVMNIAKMIFPLVTLPYLTRVLSKDIYGEVSYIKALMQYMQLAIEFGFILSGTKDIVRVKEDKEKLSEENSSILFARIFIGLCLAGILFICILVMPILQRNISYTLLSFCVVFLSCFLMDHLFRGLEEMQVVTVRFVLMRTISTGLTFLFVRSDSDILWMPTLDIIGSAAAILLVFFEMKKREIQIRLNGIKRIFEKLKTSAVVFVSEFATTAFGALNTLVIGLVCLPTDIAYWSVCMQLVSAVQALYSPLSGAVYPVMVQTKDFSYIKKILKIFLPIVFVGCVFTVFVAKYALLIVGGEEYIEAAPLLRYLTPVLFFSFLAIMFGWPVLGPIGREKEVTLSTVIAASVQVLGMGVLLGFNCFSLVHLALLRGGVELILFAIRFLYYRKNRNGYIKEP